MKFFFVIINQNAEDMVYFILGISLSRGNKALMKFIFSLDRYTSIWSNVSVKAIHKFDIKESLTVSMYLVYQA